MRSVVSSRRSSSTSGSTPSSARRLAAAWLLGSALAAGLVLASANGRAPGRGWIDPTTPWPASDGQVTLYVAAHLDTAPEEVHPVVAERGSSLRYGRVGMPALVWLAAGGREPAMPWTQAFVVVLAAGAAAAATASLLPGAGPLGGLLAFAAPGFALSIGGGYPEVLAVALCLWAVRVAAAERWWAAAALLGAALLTRENAIWVLVGLLVWAALIRRNRRAAAVLCAAALPAAVWFAFVAARFGHIPPLDPYLRVATDTVGTPFVALARSLFAADSSEAAVAAWLHLGAGVAAAVVARRSILGLVAAASALQLLVSGPFAWHFVGHAARTASLLELFVILGVAAALRPAWAVRGVLTPAPA